MNISSRLFHNLIIAAIIFRLFLATFLFHPDLKSQYFHGQFLSHGVTNIYEYLVQNRFNLGYSDTFNYPPLAYLFFGGYYTFSHLFLGSSLDNWINDWSSDHLYRSHIFLILLILKLPYLISELLTLYLLSKMPKVNRKMLILLWLYNPVSWYAVYATGQFDILPVLFTVISLYLIESKKYILSGLLLGIGAALKTYPILLLPAIFIVAPKLIDKYLSFLIGFGFWIIGFILFNGSFGSFNSGLTMSILQLGLPVSGSQTILFYPFTYFLGLWFLYREPNKLLWFFLLTTISVITFSQFHFQWVLWSMPFVTIFVNRSRQLLFPSLLFILLAFTHQFLLNDQYSLIALFSPIFPVLASVPSIPNILKINLDLINTLVTSGIFSTGLYLMYKSYYVEKA